MKIKIVDVHLMGSDIVVQATENQAKKLVIMNNNPDERNKLIKIGPYSFKPSSIAYMMDRTEEDYAVTKYLLDSREREKVAGLLN